MHIRIFACSYVFTTYLLSTYLFTTYCLLTVFQTAGNFSNTIKVCITTTEHFNSLPNYIKQHGNIMFTVYACDKSE